MTVIVQKSDRHPQSVMMLGIIASNGEKCLPHYIKEKEKEDIPRRQLHLSTGQMHPVICVQKDPTISSGQYG